MNTASKVIIGVFSAIFLVIIIGSMSNNSMAKKLDKDEHFNYSTSLTSSYDRSDKAKVYTTTMTVQETARYIMDDKKPMEYTDLNNDESIMLTYDDHYVLIYQGEGDETYVQVSSRKYVHNNGYRSMYRPRRPSIMTYYGAAYLASRSYRKNTSRYGQRYWYDSNTGSSSTGYSSGSKSSTSGSSSGSDSKIKTDKNASSKIKTKSSTSSSSSSTKSSKSWWGSKSVRTGSSGSRSSFGGGTSFGK